MIERSFREMDDDRRIVMMRTRETPSCEGAGCTADSSSEIAMPQDSNASADGRAVTAECALRMHVAKAVCRATQALKKVIYN